MDCHFLLHGIFLTKAWDPYLLHWQVDSLPLNHLRSLISYLTSNKWSLSNLNNGVFQVTKWWWTGRPGVLQSIGSQRVRHGWETELNWSGKEFTCHCKRPRRCGFDPWVRRSPGGGSGNPLYYSCLENPMDRGAWRATVHRVPKSWMWLSNWARTHATSIKSIEDNVPIKNVQWIFKSGCTNVTGNWQLAQETEWLQMQKSPIILPSSHCYLPKGYHNPEFSQNGFICLYNLL